MFVRFLYRKIKIHFALVGMVFVGEWEHKTLCVKTELETRNKKLRIQQQIYGDYACDNIDCG